MTECGAPVRGCGPETCKLEAGHKGYHSCVVYACDGCGKLRRGVPAEYAADGPEWDELAGTLRFCFLCARGKT